MSLPAIDLYLNLGNFQGVNEPERQQKPVRLASDLTRTGNVIPFDSRGAQSGNSTMGRGLPYAASVRILLQRGAIKSARELLKLALHEIPDDPELLRLDKVLAPPKAKKIPALDHDRNPEFSWLKEASVHHRGRWVALDGETLLAEAFTLKELLDRLKVIAPARAPLIHRVA